MSLESLYSSEMRHQIKQFPIWRPGDPISAGDIGELRGGVFIKQTELSDRYPDLEFSVSSTALKNPYLFMSKGSKAGAVEVSSPIPGALNVNAKVKISFGGKGAVIFASADLTRHTIDNLYEVRRYIRDRREDWPKGMVLAAVVHTAGNFRVLISESKNGSVTLAGNAKALGAIDIADASVSVSLENAAGYDSQRASGPISVTAYGFRLWDVIRGRVQLLEAPTESESQPDDDDFEEISTEDYTDK